MRNEIRFARFPNDVGNLAHTLMHGQVSGLVILHDAKNGPQRADQQPAQMAMMRFKRWPSSSSFSRRFFEEGLGGSG